MLTIKEKLKPKIRGYYRIFYNCPFCAVEFPIINSIYYCIGCRKSIVDVRLILENPEYALRYHFGFVNEVEGR